MLLSVWCLSLSDRLAHSDYSIFVKLNFRVMTLETFAQTYVDLPSKQYQLSDLSNY